MRILKIIFFFLLHIEVLLLSNALTQANNNNHPTSDKESLKLKKDGEQQNKVEEKKESTAALGEETIDIGSEPFAGNFELFASEEFPFSTETFSIVFRNLQLNYSLILPAAEGGFCPPETSLFVVVPSRADSFHARQMIRSSWGADLDQLSVSIKFIVGWPQFRATFELLQEELLQHRDLILYDVEDSYINLYLKVYVALQWQQSFCPSAQFLLKADDDTVVDVRRLLWWIDNDFAQRIERYPSAVFGGILSNSRPVRDRTHPWFVSPQQFPQPLFPPYANGPTYLMTTKAVAQVLNATDSVLAIPIEDALYTGILAAKVNVRKFNAWRHFRGGKYLFLHERCRIDKATGRGVPYVTAIFKVDPENMQVAYERLRSVECEL